MQTAQLDLFDLTSLLVSATIHDFEHLGYNNAFLIESQHAWAINYNDISVCENHHVAASFRVMLSDPKYNIFINLNKTEFKAMKKRIVSQVLATDMAKHNHDLEILKLKTSDPSFVASTKSEEDKIFLMSIAIHIADVSNPTKKWLLSYKWCLLVYEEFFH